jgi:hypothetical protein
MAVSPILVSRPGGGSVPFQYQLGTAEEFQLSSITAQWNGAAASGNFWPAVSVYSQAGVLLGRYIPPASVSAGDSAEVTYGPF